MYFSPFDSDGTHPEDKDSVLTIKSSVSNWIDNGCNPSKMTLGLGTYGRVFRATHGINERTQFGTSDKVQGTVENSVASFSGIFYTNFKLF